MNCDDIERMIRFCNILDIGAVHTKFEAYIKPCILQISNMQKNAGTRSIRGSHKPRMDSRKFVKGRIKVVTCSHNIGRLHLRYHWIRKRSKGHR